VIAGPEESGEVNDVVADYPMAVLKQSANQDLASAFVDFVLGPEAQAVLVRYGFTGA
jgi:ABC-type molybdate transport system substrate-binding protein